MYKLITTMNGKSVSKTNEDGSVTSIPFDPANTDYQAFKKDLANGVSLEDADGNTMSAEQITTFLAGLV